MATVAGGTAAPTEESAAVRTLRRRDPRRLDPRIIAVWLVIGVTLIGVWVHGASSWFIPCELNCGEAFDALQYVDNYRLYGLRYGLVQDYATSPLLAGRPFFYTHNVNIAGILFTLLDAVGLTPFWAKQLVTLAGFGAGLLYVYRATAYHTRSWLAGIVVLLLFVTDIEHVLAWGLNPLRAWHWLAIFGLLFHAGRLARQPGAHPRADWLGIVLCAMLAFGLGYDFWIICLALTLVIVGVYRGRWLLRVRGWMTLAGIVGAFGLPFVLRQIQIAAVLGPGFWVRDVVYSAAIKVSLLSRIVRVPSSEQLDAMYRAAGVHRPPAQPPVSLDSILVTLSDMLTFRVIPSIGILTFMLTLSVGLLAMAAALVLVDVPPRRLLRWARRLGLRGAVRARLVGAVALVAALAVGVVVGLAFFAPLSLHIYLKHEFPLIAAPILTIKGLVLAALVGVALAGRGGRRLAAGALALFLVVDHLIVQADDARAFQPMDVSWIPAVEARQSSTFVVSWIPNAVSVFTDTWAVGVPPGKEREVSARIAAGQPPFLLSDYFQFGERDADARPDLYTRPDFWLYFPTDQTTQFDHPAPICRQDYLTTLLHGVGIGGPGRDVDVTPLWTSATRARPGAIVTFGGVVERNGGRTFQAEVLYQGQTIVRPNFNCQYGKFLGEYQIPPDTPPGVLTFGARLLAPDGRVIPVADAQIEIVEDAPPPPRLPAALPPQPSPAELIALNPTLPVVDRGHDYVIFDLRGLYGQR